MPDRKHEWNPRKVITFSFANVDDAAWRPILLRPEKLFHVLLKDPVILVGEKYKCWF